MIRVQQIDIDHELLHFTPHIGINPLLYSSAYRGMSGIFKLGEDSFRHLLNCLDLVCLCKLDIAIGNADERLLWLHSLHTMDSEPVDVYEHSHSSMRWLIRRGARVTIIRTRGTELERNRITDETFAGVGNLFTSNSDIDARNHNLITGGACTSRSHSTVIDGLRSCDIATETNTIVSVRPWGCHHLTSIDLSNCARVSDIGVTAIAEGCHQLTSIDLSYCRRISDIGVSALAEGCPHLTSIDLSYCHGISDIGVSAIVEGCHHLTSIDLRNCQSISDIGLTAIAEGCRYLISITLCYCQSISDIGFSAIAEGCHQLTSINLEGCDGISDIGVTAIAEGCHQLTSIDLRNCQSISDIGVSAIA